MNQPAILKRKYYLYITEFFAGVSVMAVELGASRLLAPYFSSSQIVWTIIIGTIMIAMALGNIWGGRQADKNPNPDRLYRRILVAAVWIAAIPVLGRYVIVGISGLLILTVSNGFLVIAAFAACMVIFVFPLFLLGTVTPSLAKYTVDSLEDSGRVVGTLGAFNTIGSIIGTFLPTFVTIPTVGTAVSFLIFSGILLVITEVYFVSVRRHRGACVIGLVLFALCCVFGRFASFAFWEKNLVKEEESIYNYLQVKEDSASVQLSTNVLFGVQSIWNKGDAMTGMYYDYALAAPLMAGVEKADEADMLILGMGAGTYARQCRHFYPRLRIEGVEIDEKITGIAREYFDLPSDILVANYDGRAYLSAVEKKYDVIMVDAYQDITIPFQMSSVEFFRLVRSHLKENGVMVVNMNMRSEEEGNINEYLTDTIGSVFDDIYFVNVPRTTNRELFAMNHANHMAYTAFPSEERMYQEQMEKILAGIQPLECGNRIFTDDKAPVELLGMRVIDGMISNEIGYYRKLFEKEGLDFLNSNSFVSK